MLTRTVDLDLRFNGPQCIGFDWLWPQAQQPKWPSPPQLEPPTALNIARRRTIFLGWGRGVGKSWFLRRLWWLTIAQWEHRLRDNCPKQLRGVRIIPIMPTLKQFKDVHGPDIEAELAPNGEFGFLGAKIDRTSWQIRFPGGSWLKPFPASQYSSRTARGMRCDVLSPDEIDDIDALVYDAVAGPWLSEPWSLGLKLCAGTPTRGRHGLWYRLLAAGRIGERLRKGEVIEGLTPKQIKTYKGIFASHATYRDAPETVSQQAAAEAQTLVPPSTFKREWEADPDAGEGLVYPFDETFHVAGRENCPHAEVPPLSAFREFFIGMDHGWVDPGVLLLCGIVGHGEDATLWILDEWYESGIANEVWDERAKAWGVGQFWPDPSRPDRVAKLRSMGLSVGETDNAVLAGIAQVANLMFIRSREYKDEFGERQVERWARLYVSPKCTNTIREFGLYRRKKNTDGTFAEEPEDKNNHTMDACRYVVLGRFGRPPNFRTVADGR